MYPGRRKLCLTPCTSREICNLEIEATGYYSGNRQHSTKHYSFVKIVVLRINVETEKEI